MPERDHIDDSFGTMEITRAELAQLGWYLFAIPREHTEGEVTDPLVARVRSQIKKHGFDKVAGHSLFTFSGYGHDHREIHQVPEIRAFWRKLDRQLPELPALLGVIELARYNGPVIHLTLIGEIDEIVDHPELERQDLLVLGAERIIANAVERIYAAGKRHHLHYSVTYKLIADFMAYSTFLPNYGAPKL
jgi:hypothetical protein